MTRKYKARAKGHLKGLGVAPADRVADTTNEVRVLRDAIEMQSQRAKEMYREIMAKVQ